MIEGAEFERFFDLVEDLAMSLRRIAASLEATSPQAIQSMAAAPVAARIDAVVASPSGRAVEGERTDPPCEVRDRDGVLDLDRREILRTFLAEQGVAIKVETARTEGDDILDDLALFMGERFRSIEGFYRRLKQAINHAMPFTLNLKKAPPEVISDTCQLAHKLYGIAFLVDYTYKKSPHYTITAQANCVPRVINFITGGWLERYGLIQALQVVDEWRPEARVSYLKNVQISLPNGQDFELDVLFEVDGEVFWMEFKTGDYRRYVERYSRMARILGLDAKRCIMVLTDTSSTDTAALSALFEMTVVSIDDLRSVLVEAFAPV